LITAWRICGSRRVRTAFEGHGAAEFPGRWNTLGARTVYAAENRSLAALEVLANAEDKGLLAAASWSIIAVSFDTALVLAPDRFPDDWRKVPAPDSTRQFGRDWANSRASPVLRVPSVVTIGEFNYILNPLHPDFSRLVIAAPEPFKFDTRTA
jgi:RES domain-containing protein